LEIASDVYRSMMTYLTNGYSEDWTIPPFLSLCVFFFYLSGSYFISNFSPNYFSPLLFTYIFSPSSLPFPSSPPLLLPSLGDISHFLLPPPLPLPFPFNLPLHQHK
ncbi:hypothetical protein FGO82_06700, partial [Streptococcus pyogenes]